MTLCKVNTTNNQIDTKYLKKSSCSYDEISIQKTRKAGASTVDDSWTDYVYFY